MRKLLSIMVGLALAPVPSVAAPYFSSHSGDRNWINDFTSACWIYNPSPDTVNAAVWAGKKCFMGEEAQGSGTVTWYHSGTLVSTESGDMLDGRFAMAASPSPTYAGDNGGYGGGGSYSAPADSGDAYLETLRQQNRDNCARAAQGANIPCNPQ